MSSKNHKKNIDILKGLSFSEKEDKDKPYSLHLGSLDNQINLSNGLNMFIVENSQHIDILSKHIYNKTNYPQIPLDNALIKTTNKLEKMKNECVILPYDFFDLLRNETSSSNAIAPEAIIRKRALHLIKQISLNNNLCIIIFREVKKYISRNKSYILNDQSRFGPLELPYMCNNIISLNQLPFEKSIRLYINKSRTMRTENPLFLFNDDLSSELPLTYQKELINYQATIDPEFRLAINLQHIDEIFNKLIPLIEKDFPYYYKKDGQLLFTHDINLVPKEY